MKLLDIFARTGCRHVQLIGLCTISALALSACQTGSGSSGSQGQSSSTAALDSAAQDTAPLPGGTDPTATEPGAAAMQADTESSLQLASTPETGQEPAMVVAAAPVTAQCAIPLAGGPPAKPPRGRDFGQAVVKNTGKGIQRGIIQQIGGAIGGGLGAAVAGGVAQSTIRQEQDVKGVWMITDGRMDCACEVSIDSAWKLTGKGTDNGHSKTRGCSSQTMQQVAAWSLGYSFTGYDSKFEFKAADKKTVMATFNRDGIHYFSGTFADGTPAVLWRNGQTYNQLAGFNKAAR